jgi:hypothetical protein
MPHGAATVIATLQGFPFSGVLPMYQVFISGPGNAFAIGDKPRDRREVLKAQAIIKDRCSLQLVYLCSIFLQLQSAANKDWAGSMMS